MIIEVIYNQSFQNFEKEVGEYLDSFLMKVMEPTFASSMKFKEMLGLSG
jgi:hypothetical protein